MFESLHKIVTANSIISGVRHLRGRIRGIEMENRTRTFRFTHFRPDGVGKDEAKFII